MTSKMAFLIIFSFSWLSFRGRCRET